MKLVRRSLTLSLHNTRAFISSSIELSLKPDPTCPELLSFEGAYYLKGRGWVSLHTAGSCSLFFFQLSLLSLCFLLDFCSWMQVVFLHSASWRLYINLTTKFNGKILLQSNFHKLLSFLLPGVCSSFIKLTHNFFLVCGCVDSCTHIFASLCLLLLVVILRPVLLSPCFLSVPFPSVDCICVLRSNDPSPVTSRPVTNSF